MRRVEEAINKKLQPNSINRDSGIKIPEAWLPSIKKHNKLRKLYNSGPLREQHTEAARIKMHQNAPENQAIIAKDPA